MKLTRKILVGALAALAAASLCGAFCSSWYLWNLASRVQDSRRGLIHPVRLGTRDEGGREFSVYLSSTEAWVAFPELYFLVCCIATLLLASCLCGRFPLRKALDQGRRDE